MAHICSNRVQIYTVPRSLSSPLHSKALIHRHPPLATSWAALLWVQPAPASSWCSGSASLDSASIAVDIVAAAPFHRRKRVASALFFRPETIPPSSLQLSFSGSVWASFAD